MARHGGTKFAGQLVYNISNWHGLDGVLKFSDKSILW